MRRAAAIEDLFRSGESDPWVTLDLAAAHLMIAVHKSLPCES